MVDGDESLHLASYNGPHFAVWNGVPSEPEAWLDLVEFEFISDEFAREVDEGIAKIRLVHENSTRESTVRSKALDKLPIDASGSGCMEPHTSGPTMVKMGAPAQLHKSSHRLPTRVFSIRECPPHDGRCEGRQCQQDDYHKGPLDPLVDSVWPSGRPEERQTRNGKQ